MNDNKLPKTAIENIDIGYEDIANLLCNIQKIIIEFPHKQGFGKKDHLRLWANNFSSSDHNV